MKLEFDWQSNIDDETKKLAEDKVKDLLDSPYTHLEPCHNEPMRLTLSIDEFDERIIGNVRCKCGVPLGEVTGAIGGTITFSRVKP